MQLFDDDDYMVSTPRDNFFSVMESANKNIVQMEIEKMMARLAVAEKLLEENGLEEEHERLLKSLPVSDPTEFDNRLNSLFIETVGNIVTQCE